MADRAGDGASVPSHPEHDENLALVPDVRSSQTRVVTGIPSSVFPFFTNVHFDSGFGVPESYACRFIISL